MINKHKELTLKIEEFEAVLDSFHEISYVFNQEINDRFNAFFLYFDNHILPHNRKEKRSLFPILYKKRKEDGEHSSGSGQKVVVDIMEDDSVKFIQLAILTFNLFEVASSLSDLQSRAMTFDLAYHNGKELVGLLKSHIFRADYTVFPLVKNLPTSQKLKNVYNQYGKI